MLIGAENFHQFPGPVAEAGIHAEGRVGSGKIFGYRSSHSQRQPLAAHRRIVRGGDPFALAKELEGPVEGLGDLDDAVFKPAPLPVTGGVGGQNFLDGQLSGLGNDQRQRFFVEFSKLFAFEQRFGIELVEENKIHITPICQFLCHLGLLL